MIVGVASVSHEIPRRNPTGLAKVLAVGFEPDLTVRTERVVAVRAIIKINLGCH